MAFSTPFSRLSALIAQDRSLAVALPEAQRMRELNRRLGRCLPPAVARACRVVAVADGEARAFCDNGSAAARLRSLAATAVKALATDTCPVDRLRVRVRAEWSRPERPDKPELGGTALRAWDELDRTLPDGGLKTAIERLLNHHRAGG